MVISIFLPQEPFMSCLTQKQKVGGVKCVDPWTNRNMMRWSACLVLASE